MSQSIIIIGGGMIGLALANQLAQGGFDVHIIESHLPQASHRVSALNHESQRYLEQLAVWSAIPENLSHPFDRIEAWLYDHGGHISFDALDTRHLVLGYIVHNHAVQNALLVQAQQSDKIHWHCPSKPTALHIDDDQVMLTLDTGAIVTAQLIVGADGGRSWLREQLAIDCYQRSYGQSAIVATLKTEKTHRDTAYQSFLTTGPLGVLPLHDPHHVSIVWSADEARADTLMLMKETPFVCELYNALDGKLGQMTLLTSRQMIPLVMRHAEHYVKQRAALIGDAAHTIHPLAGQGANLGFQDANVLGKLLIERVQQGRDCGQVAFLKRYQAMRRPYNQAMALAMLAFREAVTSEGMAMLVARAFNVMERLPWAKLPFIHQASG